MADIVMYTHGPRAFASALVGHLYELSQQYSVVLITDPLPPAYTALIGRREYFPGLEHVITMNALGFTVRELVSNDRRWLGAIRHVLDTADPALVVGENDMYSLFDMYLMREARRRGLPTLTIQAMGQVTDWKNRRVAESLSVYRAGQLPNAATRAWRIARSRFRKRFGHILVHHVLPWMASERSLRGRSSYVLVRGAPGMRDSTLHLVQTESQWRACVASGVAPERLAILSHPVRRVPLDVFFPTQGAPTENDRAPGGSRALVLLSPIAFGFERDTAALIAPPSRRALRQRVLRMVREALRGWHVAIKAHPEFGNTHAVAEYLGEAAQGAEILDPKVPIEPSLAAYALILDLPAPVSTVLATAAAACSDAAVIAPDLDNDLQGDQYRDWPGITYCESIDALQAVLDAVGRGTFQRSVGRAGVGDPTIRSFGTTTEAVEAVLRRPAGAGTP